MKVKDIMTKNVITVEKKTKIDEVARIIIKDRIHGIPVVNKKNEVIGIITETDFFVKGKNDLYIPSFIDFMKKSGIIKNVSLKEKIRLRKVLKATAKDIMTDYCITISPDAEVNDLLELMKSKNLHTVPVVRDGSLCGIVTRADIISLIKT